MLYKWNKNVAEIELRASCDRTHLTKTYKPNWFFDRYLPGTHINTVFRSLPVNSRLLNIVSTFLRVLWYCNRFRVFRPKKCAELSEGSIFRLTGRKRKEQARGQGGFRFIFTRRFIPRNRRSGIWHVSCLISSQLCCSHREFLRPFNRENVERAHTPVYVCCRRKRRNVSLFAVCSFVLGCNSKMAKQQQQ